MATVHTRSGGEGGGKGRGLNGGIGDGGGSSVEERREGNIYR